MAANVKQYLRFTVSQIIEHWLMALSFSTLAITGVPQKFVGNDWAESMIGLMGGIELVRQVHHIAAIVMVLSSIYHVIVVAYKIFVTRVRWTMFPRLDDAFDALDAVRYNLGLTHEHPKMDRFNFAEKAEYWAMVWGTVVMALTGFVMWNPINAARFLPGDMIPASKAAHGAEAILAVLAIFVWHFYNVHIKMLNRTVFTGKMTEAQMHEEHALELERLKSGREDRRPMPQIVKQRERVFIPIATIFAVVALIGLFLATTYETTAITTLPRRAPVQVFAPITPTPLATNVSSPSQPTGKVLPASHEGRTTCMACHANLQQPKLPADHQGRTDATCSACHKPAGSAPATSTGGAQPTAPASGGTAAGPKPQPANHAGRTTCLACHQTLPQPKYPDSHAGRTDATCAGCHPLTSSTAPAGAASPAPTTSTTSAGTSAAAGPKPQPVNHAGRTTCLACHQTLPQPKYPDSHAGRTDATCAGCHPLASSTAPAGSASPAPAGTTTSGATTTSAPKAQPVSHTGRTVCLGCHQTLPQPKYPDTHAGRADATCAACHKAP